MSLSTARDLAAECIAKAQKKYKDIYDRKATVSHVRVGDWVLVRFPQEEVGKLRKLSHPWHGPYRVVSRDDPDVTVAPVYPPQDKTIRVHLSRNYTMSKWIPSRVLLVWHPKTFPWTSPEVDSEAIVTGY